MINFDFEFYIGQTGLHLGIIWGDNEKRSTRSMSFLRSMILMHSNLFGTKNKLAPYHYDGMGLAYQNKTEASSRSCHVAYRHPSAVELSLDQIDHSMETGSISDGHLQTHFRLAQSLINDC